MNPVQDLSVFAPAAGGLPVRFPAGQDATAASSATAACCAARSTSGTEVISPSFYEA
jgi:hypothetical protein